MSITFIFVECSCITFNEIYNMTHAYTMGFIFGESIQYLKVIWEFLEQFMHHPCIIELRLVLSRYNKSSSLLEIIVSVKEMQNSLEQCLYISKQTTISFQIPTEHAPHHYWSTNSLHISLLIHATELFASNCWKG